MSSRSTGDDLLPAKAAPATLAATVLLAAMVVGCLPGPQMPAGSRQLVISVQNGSSRPVPVFVASMGVSEPGGQVPATAVRGLAQPGIVPPMTTVQVVFTVPPTNDWAIYANGGELIGPADVGGHAGKLPIAIVISADGIPGWTSPGGWP